MRRDTNMSGEKFRATDKEDEILAAITARKLESHLKDYEAYKAETALKLAMIDLAHKHQMEEIHALTKATQGVVDAWSTANNLHRFIKWASGFAVVIIAIQWLNTKFPNLFQ